MDDKTKTTSDLRKEVAALRERVAELEAERTARRLARAALRKSRGQFRALIDATAEDVVVLLDADHRTVIVNEHTAKGFGKPVSELLGKRIDELLNALLDINKLDAGILIPRLCDFHLVPFLHRMHNQFRVQAREAGVQMRVFPANAFVRTDPELLARIIQNFVSNAIRYTRPGGVLLGCRRIPAGVRIEVWDRGPGISSAEMDKVFEEFYQSSAVARSRRQGLGLGLAIARRVADLLGLQIGIRSRLSKGSVFFIEVPLAEAAVQHRATKRRRGEPERHPGGSVLLVEDNETVRNAMARLLRLWGFNPRCAASAQEAYAVLRADSQIPVLALIDFRLQGGCDGIELLKGLRDEYGLDLPAILLTGDTEPDRLHRARASGYRLLHKPVCPDDLRSAVLEDAALRPQSSGAMIDNHEHKT